MSLTIKHLQVGLLYKISEADRPLRRERITSLLIAENIMLTSHCCHLPALIFSWICVDICHTYFDLFLWIVTTINSSLFSLMFWFPRNFGRLSCRLLIVGTYLNEIRIILKSTIFFMNQIIFNRTCQLTIFVTLLQPCGLLQVDG